MKTFKITKTYYSRKKKEMIIKCETKTEVEIMCKAYFHMCEGIKSLEVTYREKKVYYAERE